MSVFVKGMEMPKNCWDCDIDLPNCDLWCALDDEDDDKIPEDCPLVELPEHHGRLIDADKLIEELNSASIMIQWGKLIIDKINAMETVVDAE